MERGIRLTIGALILYAAAIPTTTMIGDTNAAGKGDFDSPSSAHPLAGCGLFEAFDGLTPPMLPPGWTAVNAIDPDAILWQTSDSGEPIPAADSEPNSAWVNDPDMISDKYLYTFSGANDPQATVSLRFWNNYAFEDGFDGGVLEVSVDGGAFEDIVAAGGVFDDGGYNGVISTCCGNPLGGRQAWTGTSGGSIWTVIEMPTFNGLPFVLRWRMGSDSSGSGEGWRIDTIVTTCERPTPTPTPRPRPTPTARPRPTPLRRPTPLQ